MQKKPTPDAYKCKQCEETQPLDSDHFHRSPTGIGGFKSKCKKCCKENASRYKEKHPEEVKAQKRKYREADPERSKEQSKRCHEKNREKHNRKQREYRVANRETLLPHRRELYQLNIERHHANQRRRYYVHPDREITRERRRLKELGLKQCPACKDWFPATTKYFHSDKRSNSNKTPFASRCKICSNAKRKEDPWERRNPETSREIKRRWRIKHPQRQQRASRQWKQNNKEKRRAQLRNYRAKKNSNGGTHTAEDVQYLYRQQKGRCYYCKKRVKDLYHVDHVIPISRGGRNDLSNLVVACPPCNQSKGGKMPHEWVQGGKLL